MRAIPKKEKNLILIMTAIGFLLAVAQIAATCLNYDPAVFLYDYKAVLPTVVTWLMVVYVIASLVLCFILKKAEYPESQASATLITRVLSLLCGAALLTSGLSNLYVWQQHSENMMYIPSRQDTFIMWTGIVSIAGCVYFVLNFIFPDRKKKLKAWFGCATIVWYILFVLAIYFDMTSPLNDPLRLIEEFALVAAMMFIVSEIRFSIQIPKKAFYISVSLIAFMLLCASSFAKLFCAVNGKLPMSYATFGHVYELVMAGYILSRLISYLGHSEEVKEEITEEEKT